LGTVPNVWEEREKVRKRVLDPGEVPPYTLPDGTTDREDTMSDETNCLWYAKSKNLLQDCMGMIVTTRPKKGTICEWHNKPIKIVKITARTR
jgi:hypothetical protein